MTKTTIKWVLQIHLEIVFCCILKYFNFYAELEYDYNGTMWVHLPTHVFLNECKPFYWVLFVFSFCNIRNDFID